MTDDPRNDVDPMADDPYAGVDIDSLPEWWRECLSEFEAHDLYTYVPAHFADGAIVHDVVEALEAEYGVDVKLLRVGGEPGMAWTLEVDGRAAGSVPRKRLSQGISIVEMDSAEFEELVEAAVEPDGDETPESDRADSSR